MASQNFTNLTGMLVVKQPKPILKRIYKQILFLTKKMPESSGYRKYTEEVIKYRTHIIDSTEDVKAIEEKIGCGQIEEVIQQARLELGVAQNFILSRPWENLMTPIPKNQWKWPVQ